MGSDECKFCGSFDFSTVKIILKGTEGELPKLEVGSGYTEEEQMVHCPYCGVKLSERVLPENVGDHTVYSYYSGLTRNIAICKTLEFEKMKKSNKQQLGTVNITIVKDDNGKEVAQITDEVLTKILEFIDIYQTPKEETE